FWQVEVGSRGLTRVLFDAPNAQVLDLQEFLHPVLGSLAADARLLHAAEWSRFGGNDSGVDAHDSVLERLGHGPDAADVASVKVRRETELRVVREGDRFGVGLEAEQRRDGTKCFLARDEHRRSDVGQDRRLEKASAELVTVASDDHPRALGRGVANVFLHLVDSAVVDEWALRRFRLEARSGTQLANGYG